MPPQAFWRSGMAERHFNDLEDLWTPIALSRSDRIATAGSCFAQHIGHNLRSRGASYMDLEPAPDGFEREEDARRFGFGTFSCRYGNIYTTRQLLQLFDDAFEGRLRDDAVWEKDGRFYDALRPGVDPVGQDSAETILQMRRQHLAKVRQMFLELDLFVFTLGLTETWVSKSDGTVFPTAPGTIAGSYDPDRYGFINFRYPDIHADLTAFIDKLRAVNPGARILLTVSPVPLAATASGGHVLSATTYSKSVLRAVAGDLSDALEHVSYFPSYEIISSHANHGYFFNPDGRTVNPAGVDTVMRHFFSGSIGREFGQVATEDDEELEIMCEEGLISR
jgi:hypothetical protein